MGNKMKLKQSYETDVYISQAGYYVIDQSGEQWAGKVLLTREQVKLIADDMRLQIQHDDWEDEAAE